MPLLVGIVHWWPAPTCVGSVDVYTLGDVGGDPPRRKRWVPNGGGPLPNLRNEEERGEEE
jgi:hypothetical protein